MIVDVVRNSIGMRQIMSFVARHELTLIEDDFESLGIFVALKHLQNEGMQNNLNFHFQ